MNFKEGGFLGDGSGRIHVNLNLAASGKGITKTNHSRTLGDYGAGVNEPDISLDNATGPTSQHTVIIDKYGWYKHCSPVSRRKPFLGPKAKLTAKEVTAGFKS